MALANLESSWIQWDFQISLKSEMISNLLEKCWENADFMELNGILGDIIHS